MPSSEYLSKEGLLAALTNTHEKTIDGGHFFGGKILIRELTARQRLLAQQAASSDNPDEPDNGLYQAMLIQMCVVDPASGTADGTGRVDPRTRVPLFSVDDVKNLMEARMGAVNTLIEEITELAALGPQAMFSSDNEADSPKRGKGAGTKGNEEGADGPSGEGTGDDGR